MIKFCHVAELSKKYMYSLLVCNTYEISLTRLNVF